VSQVSRRKWAYAFKLTVAGGVFLGLVVRIVTDPSVLADPCICSRTSPLWLIFWVGAIAAVELMPVPAWRGLRFSLSLPIILAVAILYPPVVAGSVLFVGLFDSRELKHDMPLINSLFNRAEVAFMAIVASLVFHSLGSIESDSAAMFLFAGLCAATASYAVNVSIITTVVTLDSDLSLSEVFSQLRVGALPEFLLNYLGLGFVGLTMAVFFNEVGAWSVFAFGAPLVFARQMYFRSMALEEASNELRDRQRVLRALSNRMAEERQDERTQIAAYLHDDLAQSLFQLTLRLEMAKKRLASGDMAAVSRDLDDISAIKERTSGMVRSLVRDLHRNPIGRDGLGEALQAFADEASRDTEVAIAVDVVEVPLPPPIQLLIYQIGREAVMNSMKHGEPQNIMISLKETEGGVELQVRDDGKGFDTNQPQPEGHFGSVMMKERALVAGGTFERDSEIGKGTVVTAGFPRVWIEEQMEPGMLLLDADQDAPSEEPTPPAPADRPADGTPQEAPEASPTPAAQSHGHTREGNQKPLSA
jgi:signal transduction histidine kinase